MGLAKLVERVRDPTLQEAFDGLFPRDNPRDTRSSFHNNQSVTRIRESSGLNNYLRSKSVIFADPVPKLWVLIFQE